MNTKSAGRMQKVTKYIKILKKITRISRGVLITRGRY